MPTIVELMPLEAWIALLLASIALLVVSSLKPKAIVVHGLGIVLSLIAMLTSSIVGTVTESGSVIYIASTGLVWAVPGFVLVAQVLLLLLAVMSYAYED